MILRSNDEVERCGDAQSHNEADLSQSSIPSLADRRCNPRDRSNRLLGTFTTNGFEKDENERTVLALPVLPKRARRMPGTNGANYEPTISIDIERPYINTRIYFVLVNKSTSRNLVLNRRSNERTLRRNPPKRQLARQFATQMLLGILNRSFETARNMILEFREAHAKGA
jgi:hypothetical protein